MSKKRTSLDSIFAKAPATPVAASLPPAEPTGRKRPGIKQQTAYLPDPVHEQLRRLAFEEKGTKMHDYLMEGLDLVFAKRGLPSIGELLGGPGEGRDRKKR
jgi:hypothetical protein